MNMLIRSAVAVLAMAAALVAMASPTSAGDGLLIGRYSTPEMADPIVAAAPAPAVTPEPSVTVEVAAPTVVRKPTAPKVHPSPVVSPDPVSVPVVAPPAPAPVAAPIVEPAPVADGGPDAAQTCPSGRGECPTGVVQTPIATPIP
jgi:hypothetical protein